ncbi:uncharacterized protein LOC123230388 [Mangifera indica]|uniref:uncharacterized protein LOC123230388 n=1 Tax=Mangifera indica TaxID=29780 RepID=UPI001CFA2B41|nr:uncharacterized protein LOC123230388 [Mangifera indica]
MIIFHRKPLQTQPSILGKKILARAKLETRRVSCEKTKRTVVQRCPRNLLNHKTKGGDQIIKQDPTVHFSQATLYIHLHSKYAATFALAPLLQEFLGFLSISFISIKMVLQNDIDLLNPPAELEKRKHKLKRLVQSPNSFFMDVKCQGCFNITTVFSHSQTVVVCGNCQTVLCQPTGGRARLTEGCSFRKKGD